MKKLLSNRRGQFVSILLMIITVFIIGLLFFFANHVNKKLYDSFDEYFEGSDENNTEAHQAVQDFQDIEGSQIWDFAFLAIFMGFILQMVIFSFATRISIVFYWIFAIIGIIGLVLATIVANMWQEVAANPEFATTITRFPITNALLGTYFPIVITGVLLIVIIVIFGKPAGQTPLGGNQ